MCQKKIRPSNTFSLFVAIPPLLTREFGPAVPHPSLCLAQSFPSTGLLPLHPLWAGQTEAAGASQLLLIKFFSSGSYSGLTQSQGAQALGPGSRDGAATPVPAWVPGGDWAPAQPWPCRNFHPPLPRPPPLLIMLRLCERRGEFLGFSGGLR